jgi:hypothetical protein
MSENQSEASNRWVGWFLLLVASILIFIAGYRYFSTQEFLSNGIWTKGTISGQNFQNDPDGYFYSPIVTFADKQGRKYSWISEIAYNPPRFQIGQVVDVVYQPDDPSVALIVEFWDLYLIDLVLAGIGILLAILSWPLLLTNKKVSGDTTGL